MAALASLAFDAAPRGAVAGAAGAGSRVAGVVGAARLRLHVLRVRARTADAGRPDHVVVGGDRRPALSLRAVRSSASTAAQLRGRRARSIAGAVVVSRYAQTAATGAGGDSRTPRWLLASIGAAVGFGVLIPAMARLAPVFGGIGAVGGRLRWRTSCIGLAARARRSRIDLRAARAAPPWPAACWLAGLFETAGFACIADRIARCAPLALVSPLASLASALTVALRLDCAARASRARASSSAPPWSAPASSPCRCSRRKGPDRAGPSRYLQAGRRSSRL